MKTLNLLVYILLVQSAFISAARDPCIKLFHEFKSHTSAYKAVTFRLKRVTLVYQSFDPGKDVDTFVQHESYTCIREGNGLKYIKEVCKNMDTFYSIYNSTDSFAYSISNNKVSVIDHSNVRYSDFADCFLLLGNAEDTIIYFSTDSFALIHKNTAQIVHPFEDDFGHGFIQSTFRFKKRMLCSQKRYFYQEYLLPRSLTETTYSDIVYYTNISRKLESDFNTKYTCAKNLHKTTPKTSFDNSSSYYRKLTPSTLKTNQFLQRKNESISLDSLITRNRITILYFWFEGCIPCQEFKPHLYSIHDKFKDSGLYVIGINSIDPMIYIDTIQSPFPQYFNNGNLQKKLNINGFPSIAVFNSNGEIIGLMSGFNSITINTLEEVLREYLYE